MIMTMVFFAVYDVPLLAWATKLNLRCDGIVTSLHSSGSNNVKSESSILIGPLSQNRVPQEFLIVVVSVLIHNDVVVESLE
jgi:hypothetical protein